MKRLFAVALVVSLGQSSIAFAAGPIAASAAKVSKETTVTARTSDVPSSGFASFAAAAHVGSAPAGVLAQQGGAGTISQSGLTKRTKALILSGVAGAFIGIAYGIDHRVKDVTPSSLGTREDNSVFGK